MPVHARVWPAAYHDSVVLLELAGALRDRPGVEEAAALMGTPANHELLAAADLATAATGAAGPGDLVVAVRATTDAAGVAALAASAKLLAARRRADAVGPAGAPASATIAPRTLESALRRQPTTNLVTISVPGAFAAAEARRALRAGRHVFLFSDQVSLADEVALKRLALRRGLFCMGPDCGTAYVSGTGLGFANVVPRGRVGVVAASGTGLQAVACHLAARGEGLSHGIGVGGRDLSAPVGGGMTALALETLDRDPDTALIVLVSKPPDAAVLPRIERALAALRVPAVVCCLGAPPRAGGPGRWVGTLEDAADAAVATLRGGAWTPSGAAPVAAGREPPPRLAGRLFGLYTGGTLAHEARLLLAAHADRVEILDLGDDAHTARGPHPMLDPAPRAARVRAAGEAPEIGGLLLDLVLGRGAHPDPAAPLAAAIRDARARAARDGRTLVVMASVVGTAADPQGLAAQVAALEAAGAVVLPSNAGAARFAAACLDGRP